jgi:sortase (surface protein transpeptidase)
MAVDKGGEVNPRHLFCIKIMMIQKHFVSNLFSLLVGMGMSFGSGPSFAHARIAPPHQAIGSPTLMVSPIRLRIPAIGVDTAIESVGKTKIGSMDVPSNTKNVAWYNLGVLPGEPGNAVISGHLDDPKGPAVFWKLGKLKVGDKVIVVDSDNMEHTFGVIALAAYPFDKAPLNQIFGFDLERDLNLITCTGRWNAKTRNYNQRLVVYTRLLE